MIARRLSPNFPCRALSLGSKVICLWFSNTWTFTFVLWPELHLRVLFLWYIIRFNPRTHAFFMSCLTFDYDASYHGKYHLQEFQEWFFFKLSYTEYWSEKYSFNFLYSLTKIRIRSLKIMKPAWTAFHRKMSKITPVFNFSK